MHSSSPNDSGSISADIVQQAAEWLVRLSAEDIDSEKRDRLQHEFDQWQQQNAAHANAAHIMQAVIQQTRQAGNVADTKSARLAIEASLTKYKSKQHSRRKNAAITLAWMVILAVPLWFALQVYPPAYLLADARTAAGTWQSHTLTDSSHITLGSNSAVNYHFDHTQRRLELVRGEIMVEVATDSARPFHVVTRHGSIRALGTRFIVSLDERMTTLSMLESRVAVRAAGQPAERDEIIVSTGERVHITSAGITSPEKIDIRELDDAWQFRQLVVESRPLAEVLEILARHRSGLIHFDRDELAQMKVSAVLPLDDTDRALQLLARSFPVRVSQITPWLVVVKASSGDTTSSK